MYDVKKLEAWRDKVQKEIDELLSKHEPELNQIIRSEIKPRDKLTSRMGSVSLMDSKGRSYRFDIDTPPGCQDFINELTRMQYRDYFSTGVSFKDIRFKTLN